MRAQYLCHSCLYRGNPGRRDDAQGRANSLSMMSLADEPSAIDCGVGRRETVATSPWRRREIGRSGFTYLVVQPSHSWGIRESQTKSLTDFHARECQPRRIRHVQVSEHCGRDCDPAGDVAGCSGDTAAAAADAQKRVCESNATLQGSISSFASADPNTKVADLKQVKVKLDGPVQLIKTANSVLK